MKRILAAPLALVMTASAFAHNGMEHILGKVAAVSATSLDVQAKDGKITTVTTDSKTTWTRGTAAITAKDIQVGDRVVIHAKKVDGKFVATEVEIGAATAAHAH